MQSLVGNMDSDTKADARFFGYQSPMQAPWKIFGLSTFASLIRELFLLKCVFD